MRIQVGQRRLAAFAMGNILRDGEYRRWVYRARSKGNSGRWTTYQIGMEIPESSIRNEESLPHSEDSLPHFDGSLPHSDGNLPHSKTEQLSKITTLAPEKTFLSAEEIRRAIRDLCQDHALNIVQIAELLRRSPKGIRDRYVGPMVKDGELLPLFPEPSHPQQAYKTNPDWKNDDETVQ